MEEPKYDINFKKLAGVLSEEFYKHRKPYWKMWDGKFKKKLPIPPHKVSICTTSMNRTDDVRQTLAQNIEDNFDYPEVEFVLLDYNSKDGLGDYVKNSLWDFVESGHLVYYRTEEPEHYDMSHSRNIAFKLATGHIVNNVDADNFTGRRFAEYVNLLAYQIPKRAIFAKSKQILRGRLGFYPKEFIRLLGGYSEDLKGYGHDDRDLLNRAWELGFTMLWYSRNPWGIDFCKGVEHHIRHQVDNYPEKRWWYMEGMNRLISYTNLIVRKYKANEGRHWGKAKVVKNFKEVMKV